MALYRRLLLLRVALFKVHTPLIHCAKLLPLKLLPFHSVVVAKSLLRVEVGLYRVSPLLVGLELLLTWMRLTVGSVVGGLELLLLPFKLGRMRHGPF